MQLHVLAKVSAPAPKEKEIVVSKEKEQPTKVATEPAKPFSFGSFSTAPTTSTAAASPFSFGSSSSPAAATKVENQTSSSSAAFSFSANSTPAVSSFGAFSFGAGVGAGASGSAPVAQVAPATGDAGDDEDQPPVVEIKQVEETDALYSKKCKLFYKKGEYKEKGVGMLYLKSVEGNKTQLLVRADTNLGNVLLNILLSSQMPTTRVGKNNVMIVCVPNPPIDPKDESSEPCPMLLR